MDHSKNQSEIAGLIESAKESGVIDALPATWKGSDKNRILIEDSPTSPVPREGLKLLERMVAYGSSDVAAEPIGEKHVPANPPFDSFHKNEREPSSDMPQKAASGEKQYVTAKRPADTQFEDTKRHTSFTVRKDSPEHALFFGALQPLADKRVEEAAEKAGAIKWEMEDSLWKSEVGDKRMLAAQATALSPQETKALDLLFSAGQLTGHGGGGDTNRYLVDEARHPELFQRIHAKQFAEAEERARHALLEKFRWKPLPLSEDGLHEVTPRNGARLPTDPDVALAIKLGMLESAPRGHLRVKDPAFRERIADRPAQIGL